MPLLVTPRSLNRVVALDQQKLFYDQHQLFSIYNIMSKCGSINNGGQDEAHSYDNLNEENGK
ncbi:CLUMA_CG000329, isoform A [Clunio marinus]|uniref:CLUMA_CG000329, isoform A n=1 Tax=Clunio marinus TaxID=568069 RepID=A0A1J1HFZ6_9DIPT|nr:CLUMA_CG000329, isoform A [Clunio marinus]